MNILSIGNSFSEDAMRYLHGIAAADGESLQTANLFIGGCSLEQHYLNMLSGESAYTLQSNGCETGTFISLREALLGQSPDIVTLQQVSHRAFDRESYLPYISALADFVHTCAPKARLYLHQTWAYEEGSIRLRDVAKYDSADGMLSDVVRVNNEIAALIGAEKIIRSGELFGALSKRGIRKLHRDTFHASLGTGRYALGLLWYRTVRERDVSENGFCDFDEPISPQELQIIKETVASIACTNHNPSQDDR